MQAIRTRYLGPTDTRGARIVAETEGGLRAAVPYPHRLRSGAEAHAQAAYKLARAVGWGGDWACGALRTGYVFVALGASDDEPLRMLDGGAVLRDLATESTS